MKAGQVEPIPVARPSNTSGKMMAAESDSEQYEVVAALLDVALRDLAQDQYVEKLLELPRSGGLDAVADAAVERVGGSFTPEMARRLALSAWCHRAEALLDRPNRTAEDDEARNGDDAKRRQRRRARLAPTDPFVTAVAANFATIIAAETARKVRRFWRQGEVDRGRRDSMRAYSEKRATLGTIVARARDLLEQ
jgi:hypothetical protein